jgi:hypothetical protein
MEFAGGWTLASALKLKSAIGKQKRNLGFIKSTITRCVNKTDKNYFFFI